MKRNVLPNQQEQAAGSGRTDVRPYDPEARAAGTIAEQARAAGTIAERARAAGTITEEERQIDQTLADSFPASDPPSWTLGTTDPLQDER
jgi:hypothetical protein